MASNPGHRSRGAQRSARAHDSGEQDLIEDRPLDLEPAAAAEFTMDQSIFAPQRRYAGAGWEAGFDLVAYTKRIEQLPDARRQGLSETTVPDIRAAIDQADEMTEPRGLQCGSRPRRASSDHKDVDRCRHSRHGCM
jgi:hypothetical protein